MPGYVGMVLCYHCHLVCVLCRPVPSLHPLQNHLSTCLCHFFIGRHTLYNSTYRIYSNGRRTPFSSRPRIEAALDGERREIVAALE